MDELELIRWLDVLVETGIIKRWQTMLWSGGSPVFYVIDSRLYSREDAVGLVRYFEMGNGWSWFSYLRYWRIRVGKVLTSMGLVM